MSLLTSIKKAATGAIKKVAQVGAKITSNPIISAVAGFVPGGSAVLKVASKVTNLPALKAAVAAPMTKAAPVVSPNAVGNKKVQAAPVVTQKPSPKAGAAQVAYKAITERMKKHG